VLNIVGIALIDKEQIMFVSNCLSFLPLANLREVIMFALIHCRLIQMIYSYPLETATTQVCNIKRYMFA